MKSIIKSYLKIFLLTGLIFGILMTITNWMIGNELSILKMAIPFFVFGLFMATSSTLIHLYRLKGMGITDFKDEHFKTHYKESTLSKVSKSDFINKIKMDDELNQLDIQEKENGFIIRKGWSFLSWGEKIGITVNEKEKHLNEFTISSQPLVGITMVDYGKNMENVERIIRVLKN